MQSEAGRIAENSTMDATSSRRLSPVMELAARCIRRLPSGRQRLLKRLAPVASNSRFVARFPRSKTGLRFECEPNAGLTWTLFCDGEYESRESDLIQKLLTPGATFVDIGANWGYFTLLAADAVGPHGRVVAVEADPRNYERLCRNVRLNGLDQVTVLHAAAASKPGVLNLVGYNEAEKNHGISHIRGDANVVSTNRMPRSGDPLIEVQAETVDTLLDNLGGVDRVDLLKMDIEGAEALALPGMLNGLRAGRYRRITIELHCNVLKEYSSDSAALMGLFDDAGYTCYFVESDHLSAVDRSSLSTRHMLICLAPGETLPPTLAGEVRSSSV